MCPLCVCLSQVSFLVFMIMLSCIVVAIIVRLCVFARVRRNTRYQRLPQELATLRDVVGACLSRYIRVCAFACAFACPCARVCVCVCVCVF